MVFLSVKTASAVYGIFFGFVYGCIAAIIALSLVFGLRARRNVRRESVTRPSDGFSPLDVGRIFIGKTYPRKMTRALLAHWAQRGYISIEYVSKYKVWIKKLKPMPPHFDPEAEFFDRGTYVRERDLFNNVLDNYGRGEPINILRPLFTKDFIRGAFLLACKGKNATWTNLV